jgi:ribosome-binding protein aMBF1 (putative translation factor)
MTVTEVPTFTVGDRLRKARQFAGIGSQQMADDLEVGRSSVQRWERAESVPRRTLLA